MVGVIALVPTLLSTGWGKELLCSYLEEKFGGDVSMQDVDLNWFDDQRVSTFQLIDEKKQLIFTFNQLKTDATLWQILFQDDFGHLFIQSPILKVSSPLISLKSPKHLPWQQSGLLAAPELAIALPESLASYSGSPVITNGMILFTPPNAAPITFSNINVIAHLDDEVQKLVFELNAETNYAQFMGHISSKGSVTQLSAFIPSFDITSNLTQLPIQGLEQIIARLHPKAQGLLLSMFGETIDLALHTGASLGNFTLDLTAKSPNLQAAFSAASENGQILLKQPGTLSLNLTPGAFKKLTEVFPDLPPLTLGAPSQLQVALQSLSCPMPKDLDDLKDLAFQAALKTGAPLSFTLGEQSLNVTEFYVGGKSSRLRDLLELNGQISVAQGSVPGTLTWSLNLRELRLQGDANVSTTNFPIALLGNVGDISLQKILGATIELSAQAKINAQENQIHLSAKTPLLTLSAADFTLTDSLTLLSRTTLSYTPTPALFNQLMPSGALSIAEASPISLELGALSLPLRAQGQLQLSAKANLPHVVLTQPTSKSYAVDNSILNLEIAGLDHISCKLTSSLMQASAVLAYAPGQLQLTEPFQLTALIDNALMGFLLQNPKLLAAPAQLQLSINPFSTAAQLNLSGKATLETLALAGAGTSPPITLQNLNIPFQWNGKSQSATAELSGNIAGTAGQGSTLQMQASLSNLPQPAISLSGNLQKIPTALVDAFAGQAIASTLLGEVISTQFKLQSQPAQQSLSLTIASPNLNANANFSIDANGLQLAGGPAKLQWTLTPQGYLFLDQLLTGQAPKFIAFHLQESTTFQAAISRFHLPVQVKEQKTLLDRIPELAIQFSPIECAASISNPSMMLVDNASQELIQLTGLSLSCNKGPSTAPLQLALSTQVATQGQNSSVKNKSGSLTLSSTLSGIAETEHELNFTNLSASIQMRMDQFPSRILDVFARTNGNTSYPFSTLFGETIGAALSAEIKDLSGPIAANVNSPNTRFSVSGHLQNGALMLEDTVYAQLKVTPEISHLVLKEVNPLSLSYFYSENPITIEIPAQGFYLPLYPFNIGKSAIPAATLELGKISCRNEGNVNIALSLLKTRQFDAKQELNLWFAPMVLHLKSGLLDMERTEILLADTFDIAIWGNIDLLNDYVDMLLGLTAQTLRAAFGIKDLPADYVLTLPMRGKMDNVQINTSKATAKIALLLAWQQKALAGAMGGGPAGAIVGDFLGKIATLPDKDANIPPAKHPFPWEVGKKDQRKQSFSDEPKSKGKHFKQREKPLKQIMKLIK